MNNDLIPFNAPAPRWLEIVSIVAGIIGIGVIVFTLVFL